MIAEHNRVYGEDFIGEKFVSHIWDNGHFTKDFLRAKDGRRIEVLYQGQWNDDSGADFRNAEIKIDGQTLKGDVEVHVRGSHWRVHHHHVDPKYNNTILHVVMWDDGINLLTRKQNGERIPTLILYDYLDSSIGKLWKKIEEAKDDPPPCRKETDRITPETIGDILDHAGMERFLQRAKVLEKQLQEKDADQLLYEGIMDALGYSKNRKQFVDLARKAPLETMIGQSPERIQALLFGTAGLIPFHSERNQDLDSETRGYLSRMEELWNLLSPAYKIICMFKEQWEFFRIRPENYPTKRIAGMSYILSNCRDAPMPLLTMFSQAFSDDVLINDPRKAWEISRRLRDTLMPGATGYWTRHYSFGSKQHKESPFLIGQSRAADIVVNIVLPVIFTHARKLQNEKLEQAVTQVYINHRRLQDNKIVRYVAGRIFRDNEEKSSVVKSAVRQQGLIHLYKTFCVDRNCRSCPVMLVGNPK